MPIKSLPQSCQKFYFCNFRMRFELHEICEVAVFEHLCIPSILKLLNSIITFLKRKYSIDTHSSSLKPFHVLRTTRYPDQKIAENFNGILAEVDLNLMYEVY